MIHLLVELSLALAALPLLAASGYLFVLSLFARPAKAQAGPGAPRMRFEVVVPAHDEEAGIALTVRSLLAVRYPPELFRVRVVADNCTDATAERAFHAGAAVLVRSDSLKRGKGYALALAFERALAEGTADALVVVDADTVVSENLLESFAAHLEAGALAVQAHYGVRNPTASWRTRLMVLALALFHRVRSLGRERLGVSCGLRGNGMCFSTRLLREVPYDAFSLVEDLEYGIRLGRSGHRVAYADEARVLGEMVSREQASRSQRRRWEVGRLALARTLGVSLAREALSRRSGLLLDLALDVLVPPLARLVSVAVLGTAVALGLCLALGTPLAAGWLWVLCDVFLITYVLSGWWRSGIGARGLVDLLCAPLYMLWKLTLFARRPHARKNEWVRTAREGGTR